MDEKKVVTGMYLELNNGSHTGILNWIRNDYNHKSITTLELTDGSELKIVTEYVTVNTRKRRDY